MTLTLTAHDQSKEAKEFFARVLELKGRVTACRYETNSTATYTAYVPDQPEILTQPHPNHESHQS